MAVAEGPAGRIAIQTPIMARALDRHAQIQQYLLAAAAAAGAVDTVTRPLTRAYKRARSVYEYFNPQERQGLTTITDAYRQVRRRTAGAVTAAASAAVTGRATSDRPAKRRRIGLRHNDTGDDFVDITTVDPPTINQSSTRTPTQVRSTMPRRYASYKRKYRSRRGAGKKWKRKSASAKARRTLNKKWAKQRHESHLVVWKARGGFVGPLDVNTPELFGDSVSVAGGAKNIHQTWHRAWLAQPRCLDQCKNTHVYEYNAAGPGTYDDLSGFGTLGLINTDADAVNKYPQAPLMNKRHFIGQWKRHLNPNIMPSTSVGKFLNAKLKYVEIIIRPKRRTVPVGNGNILVDVNMDGTADEQTLANTRDRAYLYWYHPRDPRDTQNLTDDPILFKAKARAKGNVICLNNPGQKAIRFKPRFCRTLETKNETFSTVDVETNYLPISKRTFTSLTPPDVAIYGPLFMLDTGDNSANPTDIIANSAQFPGTAPSGTPTYATALRHDDQSTATPLNLTTWGSLADLEIVVDTNILYKFWGTDKLSVI